MSMFDDLAAQYSALPSWAQIGIPVAGLGGVAFIALHKGSGSTAVVSGPGVSAGASNGGGGNNSSAGGSAPPISSNPGGGGTPQSQPGPSAPPINFIGPPTQNTTTNLLNEAYGSAPPPVGTILANQQGPGQNLGTIIQGVGNMPNVSSTATFGGQPGIAGYVGPSGGVPTQGAWDPATGISQAAWYANNITPLAGTGPNARVSLDTATSSWQTYIQPGSNFQAGAVGTIFGGSASQPGTTNYSAANATLYHDIQVYQNVANPTAAQKAALATDLATYQRQGGTLS